MVGRFVFGMIAGGVLVTVAMVLGSALFPLAAPTPAVSAADQSAPIIVASAADPVEAAADAGAATPSPQPDVTDVPSVDADTVTPTDPAAEVATADASALDPVSEAAPDAQPEAAAEAPAAAVIADPPQDPGTDATNGALPEQAPAALPSAIAADEPDASAGLEPPTLPEDLTDETAPVPAAEMAVDSPAKVPDENGSASPEADPQKTPAVLAERGAPDPAPEVPPASVADGGPVTDPVPDSEPPQPETPAADTAEVALVTEDPPSTTFKPAPGFSSEGSITERGAEETEAAESADDAATANLPIKRFAAGFDNPEGKPVLAIVLIDTGAADLDRAGLAALPFPVSFALDPMNPSSSEWAAIYRAAGREVIMLATGIAPGSEASDIEVAFQAMTQRLPEAVAVMDLSESQFQNDRPLASLVVPVIGGDGRGLLTWEKGLNAADQVARRDGIASAVIFRDLAMGGGDAAAAQRTLDRAVFKAGQEGRVVVAGLVTPELVTALLEWSVEGRAGAVALAPVTAAMLN